MYMQEEYNDKTNIYDINTKDNNYYKNIANINFGHRTESYLKKENKSISEAEVTEFRQACLDFLIEACDKLRHRYNFGDVKFPHLSAFSAAELSEFRFPQ